MKNIQISTPHYLPVASFAAAFDCIASDPLLLTDPTKRGRHAIGINVQTAGTAVVRPLGYNGTTVLDRTLTLVAGKDYPIEFTSVRSGTATNAIVYWDRV